MLTFPDLRIRRQAAWVREQLSDVLTIQAISDCRVFITNEMEKIVSMPLLKALLFQWPHPQPFTDLDVMSSPFYCNVAHSIPQIP
jgi:hypothetical protein